MRILIADDHEIMRRGVRSILAAESQWEICGEAVDGCDAVNKVEQLRPDVVVMDVSMPVMNGLEAARTIRQSFPEIEVLMLTQHESQEMLRQAFKAGAKGYVSKSAIPQNLVSAVKKVGRHEFFAADSASTESNRPQAAGTQQILQREVALERALRESEERFRSTFEQVAVGMAHVGLDAHFLRMNQKLREILGYPRTGVLNVHFRDVTHPEDMARSEEEFAKLLSGVTTYFSIVKRYIHQDGSVIWANTTSSLVRDSQGAPNYVVTVVEDITAGRQAESKLNSNIAETVMRLELAQCALREKDEQLHIALAASQTGTFRWDPQTGELLEFGQNAKRLFGFALDETVTNVSQLMSRVHSDDLPIISSATERCRAGEDLQVENRVVLPDGSTRWLYARGKATLDSNGHSCVVGALTDITNRKEAEEAARQSDANRRFALESARLGDWELDLTTQKAKCSLLHNHIFGYSSPPPEWSYGLFLQHVHPLDREMVDAAFQRSLASGNDWDFECRIIPPDHSVRWIWGHAGISYDGPDKRGRMVGTVMDITDRKRTEEALRQSVSRFQRFVESNVIGIAIADMNRIAEANDVFLDIVGFSRDDLAEGKVRWEEMTPTEFQARDTQAVAELTSLGACAPFEKEFIRKDGSRVPALVGATVLDSSPPQWMFFVLDLSALKRVETELREARDELENRVELRTRELVRTLSNLEAQVKVRKEAEEKMRHLSARLLHLQDDERRRIARDLHDTCGQSLSAIKMASDALKKIVEMSPACRRLFDDLDALTEQALEEVRTTSHLLHPPLLDEVGFASAARWFVEGLAERSRIEIDLDIQLSERIPSPLELVLFRVLQESLTNLHRHSGSSRATIRCEQASGRVILTVRDYGSGMPADVLDRFRRTGVAAGVGLVGMQERVRELNGQIEIDSGTGGTVVTVTIPIPASAEKSDRSTAGGVGQRLPLA